MANFWDKFKNRFLGEDEYDEYDEYEDEYEEYYDEPIKEIPPIRPSLRTTSNKKTNSKVVNINTNIQMEVVVTAPVSVEEASEVCDSLKSRKTIVVNLEDVEHKTAQRITDFLCGACYALDGSIQMISNGIFIIGPMNVDISGQFKEDLKAVSGIKFPSSTLWK